MKGKFYITTPIYYPSANFHIGHCYTTITADSIARYKRLQGYDVFFLTGTDEHGQKIERKANEAGVTPKQYVDKVVANAQDLWNKLHISNNDFLRTTDERHIKLVQKVFKILYDKGDIYKSEYEGLYCTPCESFWTETQLVDGKCPDCGRDVELVKEESYFFRLSKYQDRILKLYEEHPEFIQPESRKNEMLNNFLKPGLTDLCVSRTTFEWGIPVEFDPGHIVYVWIDALSNYLSAIGYLTDNDERFKTYWSPDLQLVGKEITRFHAIIWPALLMALDLPLPKQVYGHGWLVINGDKISKSLGNYKDPREYIDKYGVDALRYFILREVPFGNDGNFSEEALISRTNSDLANDLGNLVSRTTAMADKYFDGKITSKNVNEELDEEFKKEVIGLKTRFEHLMDNLQINTSLAEIFKIVSRANKYIDETMPWLLAKDEAKKDRLETVLYNLLETIRMVSILIQPTMVETPEKIWKQIGIVENNNFTSWENADKFLGYGEGLEIIKGDNLFPRIEIDNAIQTTEKVEENIEVETAKKEKGDVNMEENNLVSISDFEKIKLKTAKIVSVDRVENADKLYKIQLKVGEEDRQIVSGLADYYTIEELVGKTIIIVSNLKPAKFRGVVSNGMLLCAEDENDNVKLLTVDGGFESGCDIH